MEKYITELEILKKQWIEFIKINPLSKFEENKFEKNKIKKIILRAFNDDKLLASEKINLIKISIKLLAEFTGCSEDLFISREIINDLINNKIIDKSIYKLFNENSPIKRWF